jgi:hypothetical protein
MVNGQFVDPMEIDVPEGASVAAKVERTTAPADEQAAIIPAERIAALQTRQSPSAKTSAALAASLQQPSPKPVQSAEHTPLQRIAAAPTQHLKRDERRAEHDRRMRSIQSKVTASTLMIMR